MLKRAFVWFWILPVFVLLAEMAFAKAQVPGRTKYRVNDYAGIIDEATKKYLERLASSVKQKAQDPVEVTAATFTSLDGWDPADFAHEYGEKWRLSKTGRDNGVMLLVALKESRVMIGVGRNLKGIITDTLVDDITRNAVIPEFKKGSYAEGIKHGIEAIVNILNAAEIPKDNPLAILRNLAIILTALVILFFLFTKK